MQEDFHHHTALINNKILGYLIEVKSLVYDFLGEST